MKKYLSIMCVILSVVILAACSNPETLDGSRQNEPEKEYVIYCYSAAGLDLNGEQEEQDAATQAESNVAIQSQP